MKLLLITFLKANAISITLSTLLSTIMLSYM